MAQQPQVSFYALKRADSGAALHMACRVTEKAIQLGHRVHLRAESLEQARQLDLLLWQFKPDSFLPHSLLEDGRAETVELEKITLGFDQAMPKQPDVLINLAADVWDLHQQFNDIREIVPDDEVMRERGRQRYRHYQNLGYQLKTLSV